MTIEKLQKVATTHVDASFKAEVASVGEIISFKNECSINIDCVSTEDIFQPVNYIELWRLILWDKVVWVYFDDKGV